MPLGLACDGSLVGLEVDGIQTRLQDLNEGSVSLVPRWTYSLRREEVGNLSASLPRDAAPAPHLPMSASRPLQQPEVQARQRDEREEKARSRVPGRAEGTQLPTQEAVSRGQHFKAKRDPSLPS